MDKIEITINDFNEIIKTDSKVRNVFLKVQQFEKWLSLQGEELKKQINK